MAVEVVDRRACFGRIDSQFDGVLTVVDAEVTLDDNGKKVYIYTQWISNAPDDLDIATFRGSMYDIVMSDGDDVNGEMDAMNRLYASQIPDKRYGEYYSEVRNIVANELKEHNIKCALTQ